MGSQRVAHDWATSLAAHRHLAEQVSWSRRNSPTFSHQAFLFCWVCPIEPPSQWSIIVVWAADTLRVIRKANKQTSKNRCLPVYLEAIIYFLIFLFLFICYWSVAKSCVPLWDPMNCSTPGFFALHHLPEFAQTHVHWVSDAIRPSHPLSPPSPSFSLPQHQGLFQCWLVASASTSASVLPVNIQDWFLVGWTGWISLQSKGLSRVFSSTTVWKHHFFGSQPSLQSNVAF